LHDSLSGDQAACFSDRKLKVVFIPEGEDGEEVQSDFVAEGLA
jgi:hypothetical protein